MVCELVLRFPVLGRERKREREPDCLAMRISVVS